MTMQAYAKLFVSSPILVSKYNQEVEVPQLWKMSKAWTGKGVSIRIREFPILMEQAKTIEQFEVDPNCVINT